MTQYSEQFSGSAVSLLVEIETPVLHRTYTAYRKNFPSFTLEETTRDVLHLIQDRERSGDLAPVLYKDTLLFIASFGSHTI